LPIRFQLNAPKPKFAFHKDRRDLELEDSGPIRIADIAPTARKKRIALNHAEGFF